jgi:non-ribosomal peptide synthetase component F
MDHDAGDLVRWLPGGVVDFIGRLDNQARPSLRPLP